MKQTVRELWKTIRVRRMHHCVPDRAWAERLVYRGLSPTNLQFEPGTNSIFLPEFDLHLSLERHLFFIDAIYWARLLCNQAGAVFSILDGDLQVQVGGITVAPQTAEELFILAEIFVRHEYKLSSPVPVVVWDIGMNVGFASLYFATMESVVAVRSFEPFSPTFKAAQCNLALNPERAKKIKAYPFGISATDGQFTAKYANELKGHASLDEDSRDDTGAAMESAKLEQVRVVGAAMALDRIRSEFPGIEILAKIDCEGSEYVIIESLSNSGKLRMLRALIIEWHKRGPDVLVEQLRNAGFIAFATALDDRSTGMIYAVRI